MLQAVAQDRQLVTVALNTHGTRAVQKLIETLSTPEQASSLADVSDWPAKPPAQLVSAHRESAH